MRRLRIADLICAALAILGASAGKFIDDFVSIIVATVANFGSVVIACIAIFVGAIDLAVAIVVDAVGTSGDAEFRAGWCRSVALAGGVSDAVFVGTVGVAIPIVVSPIAADFGRVGGQLDVKDKWPLIWPLFGIHGVSVDEEEINPWIQDRDIQHRDAWPGRWWDGRAI